ncbi:MAG TPA: nuclear transport factor 2 family protein [Kofleriaceae bacterium]|nr:nuclear transport factor 2 family protein [Kofleriaceae bacterium]
MTTLEVGKKLVELCKQGKNQEAMETLYAPDIVSVEAAAMANFPAEARGLEAVAAKGKWWSDNHTVHSASCDGPWPNGERFIVRFSYDVTNKPSNQRFKMDETALFTVKNGKIVREEFFYVTG